MFMVVLQAFGAVFLISTPFLLALVLLKYFYNLPVTEEALSAVLTRIFLVAYKTP